MSANDACVIVGASLAGAKAAQALREEGFDGPLVLIGDERERPYERPPLSKGYLTGKDAREQIYVHPPQWYDEHDVDLRLGIAVTAVDPASREVTLADGSRFGYGKLLLTTGSSPRRLPVPGADLERVLYLRRVEDSDRIKEAFRSASRAVVIGAGWIGLETTAAARTAGVEVTVLEMAELPLLRVLGREVAQVFADLHSDHGVDLRFGVQVAEITGSGAADGVRLSDGTRIDADVVIVGVGIMPNIALAQEAGLEVDNGIRVDERLRTSYPDIYAAGDVANAFHPLLGKHIRVEHWANALHQPQTAARAMLGRQDAAYDRVPYFFTDQYDLGMEYAGYVEPGGYDQVVFRGDVAGREFIAFWLAGNRVLAGMNVNIWDVNDQLQALVRTAQPVDTSMLTDPQVPLESLLPSAEHR
ncbi:NAD(P)/FAD-dependent oxidoreductase [Streptomyces turgidiscabies]|uniref:NAD(P)/FAD-dependent oxidoreductase n=1 Tax=Streptomyces TaxID=1883 RepID=UPI002FF2BAE2